MYKKNELKNLIYIQENKPCNEQTVNGLFRSIVEPVLDYNSEGIVLLRLEDKSKREFRSILQRLEYAKSKVYDFSNKPIGEKFEHVLNEPIWGKTEFLYVLAPRFGAVVVFDYEESELDGFAQIYLLHNSKNLADAFEVINANSRVDLSEYQNSMHPDRRDNDILNSSIRKIVENLNETNQEFMISQLAQEPAPENKELAEKLDFLLMKSSFISHEMRNLFSICNLYAEIIDKQTDKVSFSAPEVKNSIINARNCIRKSMKMAGNLLLDLKSLNNCDLKDHSLTELINSAISMSKAYSTGKEIKYSAEIKEETSVMVDENKFLAVLINLIKNAVESIEEKGHIVVKAFVEDTNVKIIVANDGREIKQEVREKIFQEGVTTKPTGTGVGLIICKKNLEDQFGSLKLLKSDETSTEFEITVLRG